MFFMAVKKEKDALIMRTPSSCLTYYVYYHSTSFAKCKVFFENFFTFPEKASSSIIAIHPLFYQKKQIFQCFWKEKFPACKRGRR